MRERPRTERPRSPRTLRLAAVLAGASVASTGCAELKSELRHEDARPVAADTTPEHPRDPTRIAFDLRYRLELASYNEGAYVPLERAPVALDPTNGRIYAATSRGQFFAFRSNGTRIYRRSVGDTVDGAIAVDPVRDLVYVGTSRGKVFALLGASGEPVWTSDVGQPIAGSPVLTTDTLFVVSDTDVVSAVDREDGTVLWTYRRPPAEEITITGHAGLTLHGDTLLAAFNDGMVAGIRASDGSVLWEIDTSVDLPPTASGLPRMRDVDTTPTIVDDRLYVASFAGGLYELDSGNGTVNHRDETWTGVTAILPLPNGDLFLASADRGFARIDSRTRDVRWTRALDRGAPTGAAFVPEANAIVYGESQGSFIAIDADSGMDVARFEGGHGFGAPPAVADGVVAAMGNSASILVVVAR